ncbi:hypothetical protein [Actinoplanes sp. NPDC051859]|uniref:hypothetical protein n=1 Tax=Actinoplanes sp. NPDC051859 TaxID=3363909 RepID=UPI00379D08C0
MDEDDRARGMNYWGLPAGLMMLGVFWALLDLFVGETGPPWLHWAATLGEAALPIGAGILFLLNPLHRKGLPSRDLDRLSASVHQADVNRQTRRLLAAALVLACIAVPAGIIRVVMATASPTSSVVLHSIVFALLVALSATLVDMHAEWLDTYTAGKLAWVIRIFRRIHRRPTA